MTFQCNVNTTLHFCIHLIQCNAPLGLLLMHLRLALLGGVNSVSKWGNPSGKMVKTPEKQTARKIPKKVFNNSNSCKKIHRFLYITYVNTGFRIVIFKPLNNLNGGNQKKNLYKLLFVNKKIVVHKIVNWNIMVSFNWTKRLFYNLTFLYLVLWLVLVLLLGFLLKLNFIYCHRHKTSFFFLTL